MSRKSHPNKDIEKALKHAEKQDWTVGVKAGSSHAWGEMLCPYNSKDCREGRFCRFSVMSTPRNPGNHAKMLHKIVDKCIGDIDK